MTTKDGHIVGPKVGDSYKHYKGGEYKIIAISGWSGDESVMASLTPNVVYVDMENKSYVQPMTRCLGWELVNGINVQRFTLVQPLILRSFNPDTDEDNHIQ